MIRILTLRVREFRGLRDSTFGTNGENTVILGPNGSGKSGVVDAIDFALTGEIARLTGVGSQDLKLAEHGPHVTHRKLAAQAVVEMTVEIPSLNKRATITRSIAAARQPTISPDDPDVRAVLDEAATHPEITLARRDVTKLILTRATERSQAIQTLLHQEQVDHARKALVTAATALRRVHAAAQARTNGTREVLRQRLGVAELTLDSAREAVNARRSLLGLDKIRADDDQVAWSAGLPEGDAPSPARLGKTAALAAIDTLERGPVQGRVELAQVMEMLDRLEKEPDLLRALREGDLAAAGVSLVEGPLCPLCDTDWQDEGRLRARLDTKLKKAAEAREIRDSGLLAAAALGGTARHLMDVVKAVGALPEIPEPGKERLRRWWRDLKRISEGFRSIDAVLAQSALLRSEWGLPPDVATLLAEAKAAVDRRGDADGLAVARDYLVVAQERRLDLAAAQRAEGQAEIDYHWARRASSSYNQASEEVLRRLYSEIEDDFVRFYRSLNPDDEGQFVAELSPDEGALNLAVDFHGQGKHPPSAYHSEGHQDGMGLCLYLALLKRVLGPGFTLAVLDDVVMSVDADHRRRICALLKAEFPNTQFVITTHDEVWAKQLQSDGIVAGKGVIRLSGWTVGTGPVVREEGDVWTRIEGHLKADQVESAAGLLRRFLEQASRELADSMAARVPFRADGTYEFDPLLTAVASEYKALLAKALAVAKSHGDATEVARIEAAEKRWAALMAAARVEQWALNKVVTTNG